MIKTFSGSPSKPPVHPDERRLQTKVGDLERQMVMYSKELEIKDRELKDLRG
jgi:hypothetical protein